MLAVETIAAVDEWAPVALIGVGGDFPPNDDWAFALAVERWLDAGQLKTPGSLWAPAIPNILLDAAFSKGSGSFFESLRWSTLLAGYLGILGAFALARRLRLPPGTAAMAALCLAWNPVHLNLGFTSMTDVLFPAATTWSLVLLTRGWEETACIG